MIIYLPTLHRKSPAKHDSQSVHIANPNLEETVVTLLENGGALDIEHAHGEWRNGNWVDFDPNYLLSSNT